MASSVVNNGSSLSPILKSKDVFSYKKVTVQEFAKQFDHALEISADQMESIDVNHNNPQLNSINSIDMDSSITLFGLKKNQGKIEGIFAYQIKKDDDLEIQDKLSGNRIEGSYVFIIIGGSVKDSSNQMKEIYSAKRKYFGKMDSPIIDVRINLNVKEHKSFISANLQIDGTLTICYHDRELQDCIP